MIIGDENLNVAEKVEYCDFGIVRTPIVKTDSKTRLNNSISENARKIIDGAYRIKMV